MEKSYTERYTILAESLRTIWEAYRPIDPGRKVHPADAFFAYRLLLGRNPERTAELSHILSDQRTFREFFHSLLNSSEFGHGSGFMPPDRMLMAELAGFRFWFNTSDRDMGVAMGLGLYEPKLFDLINKMIRPGMICIDVGAQTGFYTCLMASRVGRSGTVFAFEPMPSSYKILVRNLAENSFQDRVHSYQLAASNGTASIDVSVVSRMYITGEVEGAERAQVETVRIDDMVQDPVDIIKMDIEGHEPAAIEGMRSLIARDKPIIFSECNEYWLRTCSHSSTAEYIELLLSFGYTVYNIENMEQPLSPDSISSDILDAWNVIALP